MVADRVWQNFSVGGRIVAIYRAAKGGYYALSPFDGIPYSDPDPERVRKLVEQSARKRRS